MDLDTFRLVTDLLPEAVLLVRPDGRIRAANRCAVAQLAPAGGDLVGCDIADLGCDGDAERLRGEVAACAADRRPWTARLRLRDRDGRPRAYAASGAALPAPTADGNGPLIQLRLTDAAPAHDSAACGAHDPDDEMEQRWREGVRRESEEQRWLSRRLRHLRREMSERWRLREQLDDMQRRLAEALQQQREFAEEVRRLRRVALRDGLTGLANRTLFDDRLERATAVARRDGRQLCVMMIDLDGFKAVNDTLGHHAGDRVLCAVGRRLRAIVRSADTVARLGGDEFAVLMETGVTPFGAEAMAAKIAQALDLPFTVDGRAFDVGASIGVALFPDDGGDGETLTRAADAAMYRAKRSTGGERSDRRHDAGASRLAAIG